MFKRLFLIIILLAGLSMPVCAQPKPVAKDREKMKKELREFKIKFLAQEMGLEENQKARFIEVYDEMQEKRFECMAPAWRLERQLKKNKEATEAEYEAATEAINKAKAADAAIEKSYDEKFATFLSQKQIFKMKQAENEFRKKVTEMHRKKQKKH